ncbi:MAG: hypothetical protein ACON35_06205 [Candidatus Marinamargulisbacteria bacterium]
MKKTIAFEKALQSIQYFFCCCLCSKIIEEAQTPLLKKPSTLPEIKSNSVLIKRGSYRIETLKLATRCLFDMTHYDAIVIKDLNNGYLEIHTDAFDELKNNLKEGRLSLDIFDQKIILDILKVNRGQHINNTTRSLSI